MAITFRQETRGSALDIEKAYKELASFAMGPDSPYIRAKDSLLEYFKDGNQGADLSAREKADMLVKLVETTSINMSKDLLASSIKIALENRDAPYNLAKVVAEVKAVATNTAKVAQDSELTRAKIDEVRVGISKSIINSKAEQAAVFNKTGIVIGGNGLIPTASVAIANKAATDVVDSKLKLASIYNTLMDTYRKGGKGYGTTLIEDSNGQLTLSIAEPAAISELDKGLTWAQTKVAIRQEKGFDDNMIQHAANSSANTFGLLLSSGNEDLITKVVTDKTDGSLEQQFASALKTLLTKG